MASPKSTRSAQAAITRVAGTLHRFFLPALVATYALAGILPGPGTIVREFAVNLPGGGEERISMLLLRCCCSAPPLSSNGRKSMSFFSDRPRCLWDWWSPGSVLRCWLWRLAR